MKVIVMGAGPGGYEAALYAAKLGCTVTLIEKDQLGGTCLNRGCIPTKALLASSEALGELKMAQSLGIACGTDPQGDFQTIIARKNTIVQGLVSGVSFLLQSQNVEVIYGTGRVISSNSVEVKDTKGTESILEADKIILATGSVPFVPEAFGYDGKVVLTSDEVLSLETQPQSMIIVGGGVIGCEIGQFFSRMGTKVTIVEMMEHLLPLEDRELAHQLERQFKKEKIELRCNQGVSSVSITEEGACVSLQDGSVLSAQCVLVSIGRRPSTRELGLENAGIALDQKGYVPVNEHMQTTSPNIYAIGDIVATTQLAHVAAKEGFVAVDHALGEPVGMDYKAIPRCVYTSPEIASVGLTEKEAANKKIPATCGRFDFKGLGKARAAGKTDGFVKIISDEQDVVIGGAIVGAHATEMLHSLTMAVGLKLSVKQLGGFIYPHPTMCEAIMEASHDVHGMSIHKG